MTYPVRRSTLRPPPVPTRHLYSVDMDVEKLKSSRVRRMYLMEVALAILGVLVCFAAARALGWVLIGQALLLGVSMFCLAYLAALIVERRNR